MPTRISTTITEGTASSGNCTVNVPATNAGDILLISFMANDDISAGPSGYTVESSLSTSWEVYSDVSAGAAAGTINVQVASDVEFLAVVLRISGGDGSKIYVSASSSGSDASPDPSNLTPAGGSDLYLWIALAFADEVATAAPSNYSDLQTGGTGLLFGYYASNAVRSLTASAENPGTFTTASATVWEALTLAVAVSSQSVSCTGIASQEAVGSPSAIAAGIDDAGGIATGAALGSAVVTAGPVTVAPNTIGTLENHGATVLTPGAVAASPAGLASGESVPGPVVSLGVTGSGVATGGAFGTAALTTSFPWPSIPWTGGIPAPQLGASIDGAGDVATAEALGSLVVGAAGLDITFPGVTSLQAVGSPTVDWTALLAGLASAEAVSAPDTVGDDTVAAGGVATGEQHGTQAIGMGLRAWATPSEFVAGLTQLLPGLATLGPNGVATSEAVPSPEVLPRVEPAGLASAEAIPALSIARSIALSSLVASRPTDAALLDTDFQGHAVAMDERAGLRPTGTEPPLTQGTLDVDLTNWSNGGFSSVTPVAGPNGGTAYAAIEDTSNGVHIIFTGFTFAGETFGRGGPCRVTVRVKRTGASRGLVMQTNGPVVLGFDLDAITTYGGTQGCTGTVTRVAEEYFLLDAMMANQPGFLHFYLAENNMISFQGDGASGLVVFEPKIYRWQPHIGDYTTWSSIGQSPTLSTWDPFLDSLGIRFTPSGTPFDYFVFLTSIPTLAVRKTRVYISLLSVGGWQWVRLSSHNSNVSQLWLDVLNGVVGVTQSAWTFVSVSPQGSGFTFVFDHIGFDGIDIALAPADGVIAFTSPSGTDGFEAHVSFYQPRVAAAGALAQATVSKQPLVTHDAYSRPHVTFSGGQELTTTDAATLAALASTDWYAAARVQDSGDGSARAILGAAGGTASVQLLRDATGAYLFVQDNAAANVSTAKVALGPDSIVEAWRSGGTVSLSVDGGTPVTADVSSLGALTLTAFGLGSPGNGTAYFVGDIAQADVFATSLSTAGRQQVREYLQGYRDSIGQLDAGFQLAPAGLVTQEGHGNPSLGGGPVTLLPVPIPSGEIIGALQALPGAIQAVLNGIPTAEAFGGTSLLAQAVTAFLTGIATGQAFGGTALGSDATISPVGTASAEQHGATSMGWIVYPVAIASSEGVGLLALVKRLPIPPASRVIKATPAGSTRYPRLEHDPDATLDYAIDWSEWLSSTAQLANAQWTLPPGVTLVHEDRVGDHAIIWLMVSAPGEYALRCQATDDKSPINRVDVRTIRIAARDR